MGGLYWICDGMKLKDLLVGAGALELPAGQDVEISSVAYDSRRVSPGSLFVAIEGEITNGNRFISSAIERGACAIVSELPPPPGPAWDALFSQTGAAAANAASNPPAIPPGVVWIRVADARKALASIGANFFGRPAEKLALIGITGTNGKTTTSFLIDAIVRAAGHQSGLFGTIAYRTPQGTRPATTTTPESLDLQGFLAEVVRGRRYARRARSQFTRAGARSGLGLPLCRRRLHQSHPRPSGFSSQLSRSTSPPSAGCLKAPARALRTLASSTWTTPTASAW